MIQVLINSIDRTSDILYSTFRLSDYINQQVDTCSFSCRNNKPSVNQEILIYNGADKIFGGVIVKIETQIEKGSQVYGITCKDFSQYLNRELVSEKFTDKTVTEIITTLIAEYAPTFTMDNVIGDSVITQVTFNRISFSQCLETLAELLNYSWYVDAEKDIHFFAQNDEVAPYNLTETGGNHIWESLKITEDFSQMRNQIYVIGGEYEGESRSERYVADGEQKQFPLVYKYSTITRVRIVGDPDLTVGIDGEDEEASYNVFWNPKQKYIRFKDSNYPDVDDVVEITGLPLFQVFVKVPNIASISEYGLYEFKIKDTNLTSRADAIARGVVELDAYASAIEEGSFNTNKYGLRSGQTININIGDTNEDFIIQSVSMSMRTPFEPRWSVKIATVKTLGIIRFLQKYLKIEDEITEGETLLELQEYNDHTECGESHSITTDTPPYKWADATDTDDEGKWNKMTWA
jgi:hypothetical protein